MLRCTIIAKLKGVYMDLEKSQFLPNDQTLQIDYKPNSEVLDYRGKWTKILSDRLKLSEWAITENKIDLYDNPKTEHAYVAFNKCGLTRRDQINLNSFPNRAREFVEAVFSLEAFGSSVHIKRVAVKSRFHTPYKKSFEDLVKRVKDRYFDLTNDAYSNIGEGANLTDIGASLVFKDEHGQFNTHCGAMKREQAKQHFFQYKEKEQLPEVGLYYDVDYFDSPDRLMTVGEVITKLESFAQEAWSKHQRIRKLIVGK